ncbi:hypothetical protein LTR56_001211 [Elasticomyces elasticus]|nr:hypothetical protein LTR56_001211 [Elasticomyces elasticus]KAK3667394.1 hypothetical protein LTR22_001571 [Elasticomyces elasticus]KAK4915249.1 hypothetical protein LTR49_016646 [Elasticomyces elasticus]KAK5760537.1 hypothetical protein LTS12_009411 [Elasticomyces elasticus]
MPARKAPTAKRPVVQDSGLLDLPPGMRNVIYEYIVNSNITVTYRNSNLLYTPTLSRVCRQLRKEYEGIYRRNAPPLAKAANINTADLDEWKLSETAQLVLSTQKPPQQRPPFRYIPYRAALKTIRVCVAFKGSLTAHLEEMQQMPAILTTIGSLPPGSRNTSIACFYRIHLHDTLFHVDFERETSDGDIWTCVLRKSGKAVFDGLRYGKGYPEIVKAWEEACDDYCASCSAGNLAHIMPGRDRLLRGVKIDLDLFCMMVDRALRRQALDRLQNRDAWARALSSRVPFLESVPWPVNDSVYTSRGRR